MTGGCTPLKIFLNAKHINFNTVELGSSVTKLIRIYNESDLETDYQIMHTNGSSVFFIKENEIQGTIRPHTNLRVNVTFKPNQTSLFYERVYCIARNHAVFPLDLYGSCHDLLNKTLLLNQKYIDTFRNRLLLGEFFTPKNKKMMMNSKTQGMLLPEELKLNDMEKTKATLEIILKLMLVVPCSRLIQELISNYNFKKKYYGKQPHLQE